jgi:hypothetical protein
MRPCIKSSTKYFIALLACFTYAKSSATTHHRYQCPSPLVEGKVKHSLWHAKVYDGPPEDMASLMGWDSLNRVDVYLVCTYKGTDKTAAVHAKGASSCDATDKPLAAFCD